jgi:PKD repeat protein
MKYFFIFIFLFYFSVSFCNGQVIITSGQASFCLPGNTTLSVLPATGINGYQWIKDGVDISGATSATYNTSTSGNYTVLLNRTSPLTDTIIGPKLISANAKPTFDFTFTPNNACSGTSIEFTSTVTGGTPGYTYTWDFSDGSNSNQANPKHVFTSLGCGSTNYNVRLVVTDSKGCANAVVTKVVTVKQAPDVSIKDLDVFNAFNNCTKSPTEANPNYTITIDNSSLSKNCITSYNVNWGDGNIQTAVTFPLTHIYTTLGAFNLVVTGIGLNGCNNSKTYVVANQSNPAGSLGTLGSTTNLCAPANVPFTISNWTLNSPGTSYILSFGDGKSLTLTHPLNPNFTTDTVNHIYTTSSCPSSSYTALLQVVNACRVTPYTAGSIEIRIKPTADFDITKTPSCIGQQICFNNTTTAGSYGPGCDITATYSWDFGDPLSGVNNTSTLSDPCHTYTKEGTYTVVLSTTNPCGTTTKSKTVCVTRPPSPGFTLDNIAGCAPFVITATDTTNIFGSCQPPTYSWSVGYTPAFCGTTIAWTFVNGTNSTSANPSFSFTNPGTYTITQNVTNVCGTFSASKTVSIQKPPTVKINLPIYSCGVVNITPSSTVVACSVNPPTYAWTFEDATPSSANTANPGNVTFTTLGDHRVTLAITNNCGTTIDTAIVTVTTTPDVVMPANDTLCGGLSAGPYNFTSTIGVPVYKWTNNTPSIGIAASGTGNIPAFTAINNSSNPITATIIVTPSVSNCVGIPDTFFITVNPRPSAPVVTTPVTYCQNATAATLTAVGTGTNIITWYNNALLTGGSNTAPTPSTATAGTTLYYVTQTNSFNCLSAASVISIIVNPIISGNTIITNQNICANTMPNPLSSGNVTGGNGIYNYQWQSSIDGGAVWSNVSGGNTSPLSPGILNDTIQYRRIINSTPCADTSNIVTINVAGALTNLNISANQTICEGFIPVLLTGLLPSGGGGSYTYQWQRSTDNIFWTDIPTATNLDYQPAALSSTTFYRRRVITPQCSATSNAVTITVNPTPVASITSNAPAICVYDAASVSFRATIGTAPFAVELVVVKPGGATDTIRTNINSNGPVNINVIAAGSITGNYSIKFTKLTDSKGCERTNISPILDITVKPLPVLVLTNNSPICNGASATLTASGADTYSWSPNQFIDVTTGSTVQVTPATTSTYIVRAILNGCIKDSGLLVTIIPGAVVANAGPNQILCNANSATLAGNAASVNATGAWTQVSGPAATFTAVAQNNTTVTGLSARGAYVFRWTITGLAPCLPTTSDVTINVLSPITNTIKNDTIICNGQSLTIRNDSLLGGSTTAIDSVYTYVWESTPSGLTNWQTIAGANTATLFVTPATSTCYRRKVKTNNLCESISNVVCVTVNPTISNNIISANQQVCVNTQVSNLNGTTPSGGDNVYVYDWQTSSDSISWNSVASTISYQPPVYTATGVHYFRRNVSSGNCTSVSNVITVRIRPDAKAIFASNPIIACAPFNLANAITVSILPDSVGTYKWYADGVLFGSNNTGIFPAYTITNPGDTQMIKLVTLSQFGCKPDSTQQQFITVRTAIANFTKDTAGGCGPLNVTFTNTSNIINSGIQFFWNFGNGITSTLAQPGTIAFPTSPFFNDTTYQIFLKAYNGCDTTIWRDSVKVRSNPSARFGVATTFGCSPFTLQVVNNSLGGPNTYYWDFGNGHKDTTFTTGLLSYTYNIGNVVDTFPVQLIAVNECGIDTQIINIRIAPNLIRPQIVINGSDLFGCTPHTVSFTNATTGATTYTWDFGDNTAPVVTNNSQSTILHTYNSPGVFRVAIAMSNGCSDTTVYTQVTVYAKPIAVFSTNALIYCLGDTVRVNNTSLNATNYQWFWGDGQAGTGLNPTHVYAVGGDYTIKLRSDKTNSSGLVCYDTVVHNITILVRPNAAIQSNINTVNCAPFTFNASAPGVTNEAVKWIVTDTTLSPSVITLNGINAQYTFNKPGTFTVKVIVENILGCKDSSSQIFTVRGTPTAGFTPLNLAICKTDTTVLHINTSTANDNGPITYRWLVDGSQVSVNGNFTYRYFVPNSNSLPRTFNTWLIVTNTVGCSDTAKGTLNMNPTAKANFSIANPNDCIPFIATLIDNSSNTSVYQWYVNDVLVSNAPTPVITITQASTLYKITLIASNQFSCRPDTFDVNFTTRRMPVAAFRVSDTLGCTGVLNVATTNRSSFANFYTWDWGDATATSSFISPTHLYNTGGQYQINLVASDGVCKDTASQLVRVSTKPIVDFAVSNTLTCDTARIQFTNLTQNASSYVWSFGDGTQSTAVDPIKNFAPSLSPYTVKLVADDGLGCKDSATKANLITAKVPPEADFYISPTPVITVPNYTFSFNNLTINSNLYQYQWNLGDGTSRSTRDVISYKYADTGNYPIRLIVLDTSTNCPDTIIRIARIDGFPGWLFVPNAICPNCIQSNVREFLPKGKGLKDYQLQVFTTWGELIFQTTDIDATGAPTKAWDGRFKGIPVSQDVYVWKITARFMNGSEWQGMLYPGEGQYKKTGTITVVR